MADREVHVGRARFGQWRPDRSGGPAGCAQARYGSFLGQGPAQIDRMVRLNVTAVAGLPRAFPSCPVWPPAAGGRWSPLAGSAAYQPTPAMAVYGAAKAFVLSLTEAVVYETRSSPLRVLAVFPGPAGTEFFDVVGSRGAAVGRLGTAGQVVDAACRALERGTTPPSVVAGLGSRVFATASRLASRRLAPAVAGRALKA
ncbi:SDR family NAD(P)-dependent oxidoreductase [Streptomyces sp. NPDC058613]|uniref:SDR family NAD(P)-dependent oxidoreductase n=1 Tax=unclassified Streptomyces TaxID=2593676 RepID=UPI00365F4AE8